MLRQATVSDLIRDRVSPEKAYVVITMRRYPRFINRRLRDEYLACMSPEKELFEDWLGAKRKHDDHNGAFARSKFEQRFEIGEDGLEHLARLSAMAVDRDVYLVCQCAEGLRCHREMILLTAKKLFGAKTEKLKNAYPIYERRLEKKKAAAKRKSA